MIFTAAQLLDEQRLIWFCLKAVPKHEHLAAASLRKNLSLECFAPRIRFRKSTRRGPVWFTEAMFPSYLFARFVYAANHRQVQHMAGVSTIVRFGDQIAALPDATILALRHASNDEETFVIEPEVRVGDEVRIATGAFHGLEAVVTQVLPAKERVKVLLEFLGRSVEAEIPLPEIVPTILPRAAAFDRIDTGQLGSC